MADYTELIITGVGSAIVAFITGHHRGKSRTPDAVESLTKSLNSALNRIDRMQARLAERDEEIMELRARIEHLEHLLREKGGAECEDIADSQ